MADAPSFGLLIARLRALLDADAPSPRALREAKKLLAEATELADDYIQSRRALATVADSQRSVLHELEAKLRATSA